MIKRIINIAQEGQLLKPSINSKLHLKKRVRHFACGDSPRRQRVKCLSSRASVLVIVALVLNNAVFGFCIPLKDLFDVGYGSCVNMTLIDGSITDFTRNKNLTYKPPALHSYTGQSRNCVK